MTFHDLSYTERGLTRLINACSSYAPNTRAWLQHELFLVRTLLDEQGEEQRPRRLDEPVCLELPDV